MKTSDVRPPVQAGTIDEGCFKEFWGLGGHLRVFEGVLGVWSLALCKSLY